MFPEETQLCLEPDGSGEYPMTTSGIATAGASRSRSSSIVDEADEAAQSAHVRLAASATGCGLTSSSALSSLFTLDPPASVMAAKFGYTGTITPAGDTTAGTTTATSYGSKLDYRNNFNSTLQFQQARAPPTALGPMSYLMHADTPPLATNSILFSPAGLPPRHQSTMDYNHPTSSMDYFNLISPSGTMQSLSQQPQSMFQNQYQPLQTSTSSQSYSSSDLIRPADTLLGPALAPSSGNINDKLPKYATPLPMQGALAYQQQQHHYQAPQVGWNGPFSSVMPTQPSNLSNSITAGANSRVYTHHRGVSTASSSFTSTSSSLSMDSLTWSPTGSPTSSSHSLPSSLQNQDAFMTQSLTERDTSPLPLHATQTASGYPYQGKTLPTYTYGHPLDHVSQQPKYHPLSMFDVGHPHEDERRHHQSFPQVQTSGRQQHLQQPDFSSIVRDSISPVQMSLSPPQLNENTISTSSNLHPPSSRHQGGMGGITPTRSNFTLIAPTPRVPSPITKAVEGLDADVASPESMSSPSSTEEHHEEEAALETKAGATAKVPENPAGEIRQLRRGRSGGQLSLSSLSSQQQQAAAQLQQQRRAKERSQSNASTGALSSSSTQSPAIVLPSKIKALGTLPSDEAFSASLDLLEDVPHGTKPPYLWWTLIRAAILGAPEQKLQMETLTQLIQQKYP